jgi:hypothetical protein
MFPDLRMCRQIVKKDDAQFFGRDSRWTIGHCAPATSLRQFVEAGGLVSYGALESELWAQWDFCS